MENSGKNSFRNKEQIPFMILEETGNFLLVITSHVRGGFSSSPDKSMGKKGQPL